MPPQEHSVFWWKKQINCFLWYWTHRAFILLVLKSRRLHHRHRAWMSSVAKIKITFSSHWENGAVRGEGGCCVHLAEHFKVFFSSLLLSPFYPCALIFLLIFLLTESTYSTCKCENQCLHNLKQLKLIRANHHLPGWIEEESSLCPNSHTPLQSPASVTQQEKMVKIQNQLECQLRGSSATTLLLCAVT